VVHYYYYREFVHLCKPLIDSQALWRGFHKRDRAEMNTRLVAERPRQHPDVYFDYLDVFEVAKAILGNHESDTESEDSSDEPRSARSRRVERIREPRYDREERESRGADYAYRSREQRRSPSIEREPHYRRSDDRRMPPPMFETKVVRFKDPSQEREERDAEDLVKRMRGLPINEEAYAMLYTRCALRFPYVVQLLPTGRPLFTQPAPVPTASLSLQAPAPPPQTVPQTWPVAAVPSTTPQFIPIPSFFRSRARSDGCAFCTQPGHRVRECPETSSLQGSMNTSMLLIDPPGSASRKRMAPCASYTICNPSMLSLSGTLESLPSLTSSSKPWLAAPVVPR
jgi:hypothetical protein